MARAGSPEALQALVDVMKDSSAPHAARVTAADKILDRAWGKPTQPIEGDGQGRAMQMIHRIERVVVSPPHRSQP
jgi:glycerol-3-phosphate O-acyltransferase